MPAGLANSIALQNVTHPELKHPSRVEWEWDGSAVPKNCSMHASKYNTTHWFGILCIRFGIQKMQQFVIGSQKSTAASICVLQPPKDRIINTTWYVWIPQSSRYCFITVWGRCCTNSWFLEQRTMNAHLLVWETLDAGCMDGWAQTWIIQSYRLDVSPDQPISTITN